MRRAVLLIITAALLLSLFGGCTTGSHELDERAYILTIGVDKGVADKLRFTFQFPVITGKESQGGDSGGSLKSQVGNKLSVITIDCSTIYSGIDMLYSTYSRRLNFSHAKYLIIAEDIARESVESFINGMTRSPDIRRTMYVIVCKGKASDFIKEFTPYAGASVSKSQEYFMQNAEKSGLYERIYYNEFANALKNTTGQSTASMAALNDFSNFRENGEPPEQFVSIGEYYAGQLPRRSENKFEFLGTAVFNGATMVGELNGNGTRAMLMLRGDFKQSQIVIPDQLDPSLRVGAIIFQRKAPEINITFENGKPKIHAKVFLEGSLQNVQNTGNITERIRQPEEAFERFVKEKLDETVKKCQELNCDIFNFGAKAARQFWTIQEWVKYDWLNNFKNTEITTEVDVILRRTGTIIWTEDEKKAG